MATPWELFVAARAADLASASLFRALGSPEVVRVGDALWGRRVGAWNESGGHRLLTQLEVAVVEPPAKPEGGG